MNKTIPAETDLSPDCPACGGAVVLSHPDLTWLDIAHVDCDSFYASIEKRDRPELADKPVIVGHPGGRGVATTACYIARTYGARSAMPMFQCLQLCPNAVVIPPDMAKYKAVSREIQALFGSITDCFEPVSLDEAYLDLSQGHRRTGQCPAELLVTLQSRIRQAIGITVSVGLSDNKFLAKLASDMDKPQGFTIIGPSEAVERLAPLPVKRILGVGPAMEKRLHALGIQTIGDLQKRSDADIIHQFGRMGRSLVRHAHGGGSRTVSAHRESKSISTETTFRGDLSALMDLQAALDPLCDRVATSLNRKSLGGTTVVLKLKTADFKLLTRQTRLTDATADAARIRSAAMELLEREVDGRRFRLIGVGVSDLCPAGSADPPDLFSGLL